MRRERGRAAGPAAVNVVGIDTSLTHTGLIALELVRGGWSDISAVKSTAPKTPKKPRGKGNLPPTLEQRNERLAKIAYRIIKWIVDADPSSLPVLVAIEQPAYGSNVGSMHDRSGLWWMVVQRLHFMGIPVVEISPSKRAKYATGKGIVDKDVVMAAVVRRYPEFEVTNNNEADALVLAMMAARLLGRPLDEVPKKNLEVMNGIVLPSVVRELAASLAPAEPVPY